MNIWIINHYIDVPGKGRYLRHYNFAKELQKRGHKVTLFTASTTHGTDLNVINDEKKYKEEIIDSLKSAYTKAKNYTGNGKDRVINMVQFYKNLLSVSKRYSGADVVYCSAPHSLTWLASRKIAKNNNAKLICETRDLWPETFIEMGKFSKNHPVAKILYAIEKSVYKSSDALIFTMEGGKDYLKSRGINRDNVFHINNGVVLEDFNESIKKYHLEDVDLDDKNIFKVVYTGALGRANQVDTLIDAMNKLSDYEDIKLIVYGKGEFEASLIKKVRENSQKNVVFKGSVDKRYVPSIVTRSNLNVITGQDINLYKYGMSFNKLFEYLAANKPILSNLKCNYDIIEKFNCGKTVKSGSADALRDGILYFYNLKDIDYKQFCENSKEAAANYDYKILTDKLEDIFKTLNGGF